MRIEVLNSLDKDFTPQFALLKNKDLTGNVQIKETVANIIAIIRSKGDTGLLELHRKYDRENISTIEEIKFTEEDFATAYNSLLPEKAYFLNRAKENITHYHNFQIQHSWFEERKPSYNFGYRLIPLDRVGIYVPGGSASYPSSVLMGAIPAKIAGVKDITLVSPFIQRKDKKPSTMLLAAAHLAGVNRLYSIGGAQSIAALALGTESIDKVNKLVGPGNYYVTEAKRQLYGEVGIDCLAGPSELAVVADADAPADWIAADMLAQAEHSQDSRVIVFSDNAELLYKVEKCVNEMISLQHRKDYIESSLSKNGTFVLTSNIVQAVSLADSLAPEHLQLMLKDVIKYKDNIRFSAALLCGYYTSAVYGDYGAGPNHILPTGGASRFSSPLGVSDFTKAISILELQEQSIRELVPMAVEMAKEEGLSAHALAAKIRIDKPITKNNLEKP